MAKLGQITLNGMPLLNASHRLSITSDLPEYLQINGVPLDPLPGMVLMLNKPLGMTCSHKEPGPLVYDLFPDRWRRRSPALSTIGRLDKETSGLLLITDNGALLHRIISPKRHVKKTYRATLAQSLSGNEVEIFASGTLMLEGETKPLEPATLKILSTHEVSLTITEGRYHQVRRMFAATGNHVEQLHRVSIGRLNLLKDLTSSEWKQLTKSDIDLIFEE